MKTYARYVFYAELNQIVFLYILYLSFVVLFSPSQFLNFVMVLSYNL